MRGKGRNNKFQEANNKEVRMSKEKEYLFS
jgi:hypothetical protein